MSALTDFFNVILKGESKTYDDHNWYVSGKKLKGYIKGSYGTPYPLLKNDLSADTTLGQVKTFQSRSRDANGQLWATGRYQIIPTTLIGLQKDLKLPDSTKYNKETQDKMGLQLLLNRTSIKNYIQGKVPDTKENVEKASLDVAKIWSSVGVPYAIQGKKKQVQKNEAYYSGGGDKASVKTEAVQVALKNLRANKDNLLGETKTEIDTKSSTPAPSKKKKIVKIVASIGIAVVVLGVTGTLAYLYLKKRGNLPNFMKKLNL
jgi:hypothetical protein